MSMNLPVSVPWKLIAASPDMMDTQFGNKLYPFRWRSALAISIFEPKADSLPEEYCKDRITYVKVTCSVTGYQSSPGDVAEGEISFPDIPTEELERIFAEYFACYGVLLNIAVFPSGTKKELKPVSIDFGKHSPGTNLDNPYQSNEVEFDTYEAAERDYPNVVEIHPESNRIVDNYPTPVDQIGELYSNDKILIKLLLPSVKVHAKVAIAHSNGPITLAMYAYNDAGLVDHKTTQIIGQMIDWIIEGEGINQVTIKFDEELRRIWELQAAFSLQEFVYYSWQDVPHNLNDYPHIIDFEPKTRDLYQGATEHGEILTASNSLVKTSKSFGQTESTETGINLGAKYSPTVELPNGMKVSEYEVAGSLSHKWGSTTTDGSNVEIDSSRERREMNSTTTNLTQMYNLLTGYHVGTNRATFLMLPRPHVLQPTDRRTFVQGLRIIEGVQEFFLIVNRPKSLEGMCVEATLDTGHMPRYVPELTVEPIYETKSLFWNVEQYAAPDKEKEFSETQKAPDGWVIDLYKGSSGHPGVSESRRDNNEQANKTLRGYNYRAIDSTTAVVSGRIKGAGAGAILKHTFEIFLRSEKPLIDNRPFPLVKFLTASRSLSACFLSHDECIEPEPHSILHNNRPLNAIDNEEREYIVDERTLEIEPALLAETNNSRLPAMKSTLRNIQSAMTTSWKLPTRRPVGEMSFLDTDYFKDRIKKFVPREKLEAPIARLDLLPQELLNNITEDDTLAKILDMDLHPFAKKMGLSIRDAIKLRRKLFGIKSESNKDIR
jgi:hypothetical protein